MHRRLIAAAGGSQRLWAIVLLAGVLAASDADLSTVGAVAGELERHLHISDVQVGLLVTATALVGALATVPAGNLADRMPRVPLLAGSLLLWAVAMLVGAASTSYTMLLLSRIGLGLVMATVGPVLASLSGDLFAAQERARVFGWIQAGELGGAAFGLVAGGAIAGIVSWRASFIVLSVPALVLAVGLWRKLPEPARGGGGNLVADPVATKSRAPAPAGLRDAVRRRGIRPDPEHVLTEDPVSMSLPRAIAYVLSVPSNRTLIIASALGYFFFTGVQTFAVVLLEHRFGVSQTAASGLIGLAAGGAVLGVLAGGRIADACVRAGHLSARVSVAAAAYAVAVLLLIPALLTSRVAVAVPLFFLGAAAVTAANPPLDAARLDVMPDRLWGRAEAARTVLRQTATAIAPVAFGLTSDLLGGTGGGSALVGARQSRGDLHDTFLVMLTMLVLSAAALTAGRRRFVRDVATAAESRAPHVA